MSKASQELYEQIGHALDIVGDAIETARRRRMDAELVTELVGVRSRLRDAKTRLAAMLDAERRRYAA